MNFLAHQSKANANLLAGAGAQQQQNNPYIKKAGVNAQQQTAADEGSESDAPQGDQKKGDPLHEDDLQDEGFEIAEEITQVLYHAQAHIGGRPHPEVVVENSTLANVKYPRMWYKPSIPAAVIDSGKISALQLEAIILMCQRHLLRLRGGARAGGVIGDSAGMGKGRELAGLILEYFLSPKARLRQFVWFSASSDLITDAKRDLADIGAHKIAAKCFSLLDKDLPAEGVCFATYTALSDRKHLDRLLEWAGPAKDFHGLLLFDESYKCKNAYPEKGPPSKTGLHAIELQNKLPNARVVYCSATAVSDPNNMGYMVRLGLWGPGTEYPAFSKKDKDPNAAKDVDNADVANTNGNTNGKNKDKKRKQQAAGANAGADSDSSSDSDDEANANTAGTRAGAGAAVAAAAAAGGGAAGGGRKGGKPQRNEARDNKCFLQVMKAGGVGNMEATAMHLKSVGALLSRQLSYKNASFELVEVPQAKQKETDYNKAAAFWQELTAEVMHALKSAPTEGGLYTVLEEHEEKSYLLEQRGSLGIRKSKARQILALLWGTHQRYFQALLTGMKVEKCIELAKEALRTNHAVVIGLQMTGEAGVKHREELQFNGQANGCVNGRHDDGYDTDDEQIDFDQEGEYVHDVNAMLDDDMGVHVTDDVADDVINSGNDSEAELDDDAYGNNSNGNKKPRDEQGSSGEDYLRSVLLRLIYRIFWVPPTYPYNPNGDLSDDELGLRDTDNDSDNDGDIDLNDEQQEERVNGQFAAPEQEVIVLDSDDDDTTTYTTIKVKAEQKAKVKPEVLNGNANGDANGNANGRAQRQRVRPAKPEAGHLYVYIEMAQLVQGSVPKQLSNRSTYHAPSSVQRGDIESGVPKRRTIGLGEAKRSTTRGRVIAVSRRSSSVPEQPKPRAQQEHHEDIDEHLLSLDRLAERFAVAIDKADPARSNGLSAEEAAQRLQQEGKNSLTPPTGQNPFLQYLKLLKDPLTAMLLAAAILSLCSQAASTSDYSASYLGGTLLFVVTLNTMVDFIQARKSEAMVKSLSALAPAMAAVIRGGSTLQITAADVVRGDVVILNTGDKVPADIRLIKVTDMTVDNSNLTGEGDPQQRSVETNNPGVLEADNLAFMGTTVMGGKGVGIIIARGDATVLGKISSLAGADISDMTSPLTQEITAFVTVGGLAAVLAAVLLFAIGMGVGVSFVNALALAIGIFVAAALCGIPATITMLLAYASKKLSHYNVLVKNLHGMDTLGAITLLASDKTGTLTMNVMTVVQMWQKDKSTTDSSDAGATATSSATGTKDIALLEKDHLLMCMALCNSAHYVQSPENDALPVAEREVLGDATETALLRYVTAAGIDVGTLRSDSPHAVEVPFSSDRKWAAGVFNKAHAAGLYTVYLKGAPERVLRRCSSYLSHSTDTIKPMDSELETEYQAMYESMAGRGQRVIACAMLELSASDFPQGSVFTVEDFPSENLVFLGLLALQDPPKPGVSHAIDECNTAGIQVMMITGDHPLTAEAIGREVHIIKGKTRAQVARELNIDESAVTADMYNAVVLHGETLLTMSEDEWDEALSKKQVVFARTSPQQKLEIVTRAQAMGHVVGMTGDGVNDSPALRRADMGIAMAITGSEVSREAASIVLLDDNFTSVVEGIKRGRTIFASMKKAITYSLAHIIGEIMPAVFLVVLGLPLGMSPFLVLFIDLGTEIAPVMSFAFEKPDDDVMLKQPRRAVVPKDVLLEPSEVADMERATHIEVAEADESELDAEQDQQDQLQHSAVRHLYNRSVGRAVRAIATGSPLKLRRKSNPGDEQLVDGSAFRFAFLQNGFFATSAGLITYFLVFDHYGIPPAKLYRAVPKFFPSSNGDNFVHNGRTYTPEEQDNILNSVQSAYYFTIAIMQFFVAYILKATDGHIFTSRAAWRNKVTYAGMAFSLGVAFFVTHTPGVQYVLESDTFPLWALAVPVGMGFVHLVFESLKRRVQRRRRTTTAVAQQQQQPQQQQSQQQ